MNVKIRAAGTNDAEAIQEIYAPYVQRTAISFEDHPPSVAEMRERIVQTARLYPWLVYERDGVLLGYAYASQHRAREAYRWSVDVAAYVNEKHCRQGIGKELYTHLFTHLKQLQFANAFAGIALPNAGSVRLHELMGFTAIGIYQNVGYKFGKWHDVGWWQKILDRPDVPREPLTPNWRIQS